MTSTRKCRNRLSHMRWRSSLTVRFAGCARRPQACAQAYFIFDERAQYVSDKPYRKARAWWVTFWVNITRTATQPYTTRWSALRRTFHPLSAGGWSRKLWLGGRRRRAAMRYTESRMSKLTLELLRDIDKDTVDFYPNFDETLEQPAVLPRASPTSW